ncbi:MAG: chemotaxis-specific protein-glutamate methyltransferase CheB [Pseudomonadota bacterium]
MIRVLVVDDSLFMVKMISSVLEKSGLIEVVGHALDGEEAVKKAELLQPDVITMDVVMPRMNGLEATRTIRQRADIPILILSAYTPEGARLTLQALEAGAADCIAKPSGERSMDISSIADTLVRRIVEIAPKGMSAMWQTTSADAITVPAMRAVRAPRDAGRTQPPRVVVVGASAGGISAIAKILPRFPATVPFATVIIQHLPEGFTQQLAERLDQQCLIRVKQAEHGEQVYKGTAYVAPGGADLELTPQMTFRVTQRPDEPGLHPSVDVAFRSVAAAVFSRCIAVVLTGMGRDGAIGVQDIAARGGVVLAQDQASSMVWGMPKAAISTGVVDKILTLGEIPREILDRSQESELLRGTR